MSEPRTARRRPLLQLGLQAKSLAFSLACVVVPLLVMGGFLLGRNEELLNQKIRETLSNHLFRSVSRLDGWLHERMQDTRSWSSSFVVVESLEALSTPGNRALKARQDLNDYLASVLGHHDAYEALLAVDRQGRVVAGAPPGELEGLGEWEQAFVGRAVTGTSPVFSPLRRAVRHGAATLLLAQPVKDRFNATAGALVARVALPRLEALLAAPPDEPSLGFWLLDVEGGVLVRAGRVEPTPGRARYPAVALHELRHDRLDEGELPGAGPSLFGARALEGPLPGFVVAALPRDEAYGPLLESRRRLVAGGLTAILAIFVLNVVVARSLLGPILRLSEGARRLAAGDLEVDLPASGSDEIAELTRSFNEMTRRVQAGRQGLERASAELAQANARLVEANRRLETLAITDALTGLHNRRHFEDTLERELRRSVREHRPLALLMLDIDRFKQYNDRFGHAEGDSALRRVARAIVASIRGSDFAFRFGGEEMAVLLPACAKAPALEVGEKLREAIAATAPGPGERGGPITVSIGVAGHPEDGEEPDVLAHRADMALYVAKARGRNRVVAATAEAAASADARSAPAEAAPGADAAGAGEPAAALEPVGADAARGASAAAAPSGARRRRPRRPPTAG